MRTRNVLAAVFVVVSILAPGGATQAAFPGDNGRIVFTRGQDNGGAPITILSMNPDGSDVVDLTPHTTADRYPRWSPDGAKITFTSPRSGVDDIWVMNGDGSGQVNLTNSSGTIDRYSTWSPDGQRIAFTRNASCHVCSSGKIAVVNADGSAQSVLRDGAFPSWAPDGSRIAFSHQNDIYTMAIDGSDVQQLTSDPGRNLWPDWSPDGTQIVYWGGGNHIFVMNADGSGKTQLTSGFYDAAPTFSPDGTKIVFARVPSGTSQEEIFVMNADGSGLTRLTNNHEYDAWSSWQPLVPFTPPEPVGPDATVADVRTSVLWARNGSNSVEVTGTNAGDTCAEVRVAVFLQHDSGSPVRSPAAQQVPSCPGEDFEVTFDVDTRRPGDYLITACATAVDPEETDRTNDCVHGGLAIID